MKADEMLRRLAERKARLIALGISKGWVSDAGVVPRLMWRERGKLCSKSIGRAEIPVYQARVERYRQVREIDKTIARIEKDLSRVLVEVAA